MTEGRPAATAGGSGPRRRLFVAVPVPEDARREIASLATAIQHEVPAGAIRWVGVEGLHLTLRFLGPTPEAVRPAVEGLVVDVARSTAPFAVELGEGGAFPSRSRPRVLWLEVADGAARLAAMAERLEAGIVRLGWAPEGRPYRAHLTLARCREAGDAAAVAAAAALIRRARALRLRWTVDRLVLFESHLSPAGARYDVVLEAPLGPDTPRGGPTAPRAPPQGRLGTDRAARAPGAAAAPSSSRPGALVGMVRSVHGD